MPFGGGSRPNYTKLRTNLRLCINRLKLMEKKKTELALKARVEIAEYLKMGKDDRARIRVEHIVREDYLVEAMEIVEMFCDLLLARFGLIEKMKEMDPGLEEPIATILWVTPRMYSDIQELKEVSNQLTLKYGKEYCEACRSNTLEKANEKVLHKMALIAPPKKLVESYLIEIAKTYDIPFEPDPMAFEDPMPTENLIDIGFEGIDRKPPGGGRGGGGDGYGGSSGGGGGGMKPLTPEASMVPPPHNPDMGFGFPSSPPQLVQPPPAGFAHSVPPPAAAYNGPPAAGPTGYASVPSGPPPLPDKAPVGGPLPPSAAAGMFDVPSAPGDPGMPDRPRPPQYDDVFGPPAGGAAPNLPSVPPAGATGGPPPTQPVKPVPAPRQQPPGGGMPNLPEIPSNDLPGLPSVPTGGDSVANGGNGDIDFDDLTKRFEELKRKK